MRDSPSTSTDVAARATPAVRPLFVGGRAVHTDTSQPVRSPETGAVIAQVGVADRALAEEAMRSAQRAFAELSGWPRHRRRDLCARVASGIAAARHELVELIRTEAAKPVRLAEVEVDRAELCFRIAAEEATRATVGEVIAGDVSPMTAGYVVTTERFARGPVLAISPFNFPLNLAAHKVAPALAAGCSVVLKPPPQAPSAALRLAEIVAEAGAPAGTLSVLHAPVEIAEALVADERFGLLSFTGSPRVGWHLKARAGKKPVLLELGGNAAAIVHEDADLGWAAERSVSGAFAYAGQICISLQRLYVHASVHERFVADLLDRTRAIARPPRWGEAASPECVGSALIDEAAARRVEAWVGEAVDRGAERLAGGGRQGSLVEPTVLTQVDAGARVVCEEVFGPVVVVEPYDALEDAVARVNASAFGLQASIFTRDISRVHQVFRALVVGGVVANDYPLVRVDSMPYGGVKDSGLGREGLRYAIEAMTEPRVLMVRL